MAVNRHGLRKLWFQFHKWIGLSLFVPLILISLTGSALVWDEWLDAALYPDRHHAAVEAALPPSAYAAAGRTGLAEGERIMSLEFEPGAPVLLTATQPDRGGGRPVRTRLWLDPESGAVIDSAASDEGAIRVMHVLHGSLFIPEIGRKIVGWLGVAMLFSSMTGLWLWWPMKRRWTRGLRWKRGNGFSTNLHHQTGFWVSIPLAVLSLTGAWISFPAFFGALAGDPPRDRPGGPRSRPQPVVETVISPDAALASTGMTIKSGVAEIAWPTDDAPVWSIEMEAEAGPVGYLVDDATGEVTTPPPEEEPRSGIGRIMRRIHDGDGMPFVWQIAIFIGGLLPAILGITGVIMWLRSRGWRRIVAARRKAVAA